MKILLLSDVSPPLHPCEDAHEPQGGGGGISIVVTLAKEYARRGHTVHILTTHQRGSTEVFKKQCHAYALTSLPIAYPPKLRSWLSIWNPRASSLIHQFFREEGEFDVVHAHFIHQYLTYHALAIAKKHTKRIVMTFHDVMSIAYGRLSTKRYLNQGNPRLSFLDHLTMAGRSYNPLRNSCIRFMLRNVDTKVTVSTALRDVLERNGIAIDDVIYNGIDVDGCMPPQVRIDELRRRWGLEGKQVIFLGGRLRSDKGIEETLDAFRLIRSQFPETVILLVGGKDRAEALLGKYHALDELRSYIRITGWLDRGDVLASLALSTLCVTPSVCFDSFPTVNLEAMALGKPVIGTCFGGTREIVEDGVTGMIVDPRNIDAFAEVMKRILIDRNLRESMGTAGKKRITEHFSLERQVEKYLQLYR